MKRAAHFRRSDADVACAEKRHEDELASIARHIRDEADSARVVLIGGPSSAGKTTFAKRLTYHLGKLGVGTLVVSTDDYFVGDERNPRDENGNLDYEHIRAMDLDRLNANLADLVAGREALLPRFDFTRHAPAAEGHVERLKPGEVVVIEGLHSLNPELSPAIPDDDKFLLLADTITSPFNEVEGAEPGDGRLIRRIIRDGQFRGRPADSTIRLWPSVCAGESRWITPFRGNADFVFDTTLAYEPAVLKKFAVPLLEAIDAGSPSRPTADRLLDDLACFDERDDTGIPGFSILREYIGGSIIQY